MDQETPAKYLCGVKKTVRLGDHAEVDLMCGIDMTEYPDHFTHITKTQEGDVYIKYWWVTLP